MLASQQNIQMPTSIYCTENKQSYQACTSKNCQKYAFVCPDKSCRCQQQHKKCLIIQTVSVKNHLSSSTNNLSESFQNIINQNIDKMIDFLSDFRDKISIDIKRKFQLCGLSSNAKQFLKFLNSGEGTTITGNKLWQIIHSVQQQQDYLSKQTNKPIEQIQINFKQMTSKLKEFCVQIEQQIQSFHSFTQKRAEQAQKLSISSYNQLRYEKKLLKNSKIVVNSEEQSTLKLFFGDKKIRRTQLLYRASQNDFEIKKFHEKCNNIPNTLTLIETQYNKKIGGYTPIMWTGHPEGKYQGDQSLQSFIFTLSNKDKFCLQQKYMQNAIGDNINYGPVFGKGYDLCIQNKANKNNTSRAKICLSYKNEKYKYEDNASWQRFSGNPNKECNFKIKQWQVWRVQFD